MSTVYGVNRTKVRDPSANNIVDPGLIAGRVRSITDTYEASVLVSGSVIEMGDKLPTGAIVVGGRLSTDALGVLVKLSVGDEGDDNRYLVATQGSTAATHVFAPTTFTGTQYVVTGNTDNILRITTTLSSATGTITLETMYIVD